jgi:hypothetical protein
MVIDSTTQFIIGVVVAVLAIIIGAMVAIFIYLKGRSRKLVSYKLLTEERLISISSELKDKLEIFYQSKKVEDVILFKIEIANSGNKEILETDYNEPITISFGVTSRILSCELNEFKPAYFNVSVTASEKIITLSKTLFNVGESLTVKALVSKPEFYSVKGRIAGGKIEQNIPKTQSPNFWWYIAGVIEIISLVGISISVRLNQVLIGEFFSLTFVIPIILIVIYVVLLFSSFIYSKFHHKTTS